MVDDRLIVDNSRLGSVANCDLQAVLEHVHGYRGAEEGAPAKAGKSAHVSLAGFFSSGGDVELALSEFDKEYRLWSEENVAFGDRLHWSNVRTILEEYYRAHPLERFPFKPIEGSEEKGLIYPLENGIDYYGLIDLAGHEKSVGGTYVVDHKTTGKITDWWAKKFRIGSQLSGYMWLLAQLRKELVVGSYVNAIEVGKLPEPSTKKCRTHKVTYDECWRMHAKWELYVVIRTPEMLEKWKSDAIQLARRFGALERAFGHAIELLPFVPQTGVFNNSCTFCQFRDFCAAERRPELVESMLVHDPWRPWDEG